MRTFNEYLKEVWHDPNMPGYDYDVSDFQKARNDAEPAKFPKKLPPIASFQSRLGTGGGRKEFEQGISAALPTASIAALVKAHRILMRGQQI